MREFYYNQEGYYDPTMGEALTHVWEQEKRKAREPLVLILSADECEDIAQRASDYRCRPVTMDRYLDLHEAEFLKAGKGILEDCDEVWVIGREITRTMKALIRIAEAYGIEVRRMR